MITQTQHTSIYEILKMPKYYKDSLLFGGDDEDDEAEEALEQEEAEEQAEAEKARKRQDRMEEVATQNIKASITSPLAGASEDDEETLG